MCVFVIGNHECSDSIAVQLVEIKRCTVVPRSNCFWQEASCMSKHCACTKYIFNQRIKANLHKCAVNMIIWSFFCYYCFLTQKMGTSYGKNSARYRYFFLFFGICLRAVFFTTRVQRQGAFCWKMSWAVKSPIGSALLVDPCRPYSPFKPWPDGYLGRDLISNGGTRS